MMSYGDPAVARVDARRATPPDPLVRSAVEAGITFFDTADMYSMGASEEVTGRLLRELFADRDDYVLATKVYMPMGDGPNDRGLSRKHILAAIDASLRRLGTDYVDLYQIHRWDVETPIEETMEALHDVVRAGKARYIGASSMYAWQFAKAQHAADRARLDPVRLHAEPLQPPLPRGGAGDAPAVPRPGRRRDPVEPARPRAAGRQPQPGRPPHRPGAQRRLRRQPLRRRRLRRRRRGRRGRRRARPAAGAGRAGLAAAQARRHRADRRGDQAAATSTTRSPRSRSSSARPRSTSWRAPTCPTRSSGH